MFDISAIAKKYIWAQFTTHGFKNQVIELGAYQIQYWDSNSEKEIMLILHGFGVQAEFQWYPQIAVLAQKYRVIMPNLLYFGDTKPIHQPRFELQDQVLMIQTFINFLTLDPFIIAGISYGGLISMEYYRQNRDRIQKMILIDAPVKYLNQEDLKAICKRYEVDSIMEFFAPKSYLGLKKQLDASYYQKRSIPTFVIKNLYNQLCLPNILFWEQLIVHLLDKMDYYSEIEYAPEIPILLIWGAEDDIIPVRIGKELSQSFKNCFLETIPKTKHLPNLENARLFNKILMNFLK
jgi:pimeloyl-ACP methyl ester carboxylesterase